MFLVKHVQEQSNIEITYDDDEEEASETVVELTSEEEPSDNKGTNIRFLKFVYLYFLKHFQFCIHLITNVYHFLNF